MDLYGAKCCRNIQSRLVKEMRKVQQIINIGTGLKKKNEQTSTQNYKILSMVYYLLKYTLGDLIYTTMMDRRHTYPSRNSVFCVYF